MGVLLAEGVTRAMGLMTGLGFSSSSSISHESPASMSAQEKGGSVEVLQSERGNSVNSPMGTRSAELLVGAPSFIAPPRRAAGVLGLVLDRRAAKGSTRAGGGWPDS